MEAARTRRHREKLRAKVREYKTSKACMDCGETHPACLQFHHRDPSQKIEQINRLVLRKRSTTELWAEIEKCDVLCANCHAKRHWNNQNATTEAA